MTRTFAPSSEFFNVADAGAGGNANAGAGGGHSPGAGQQGSGAGAGAGAGGGGGPAPITFTDDTMFVPPGSTQPVKWGDYSKQYVHTDRVKAQQAEFATQFLANLAKTGRGKQPGQGQGQGQGQPQHTRTQPVDMFAGVRDLPLIDGRSLADLGERIQREGIAPLYEWAGQVNKVLTAVNQRLQQTERTAGGFVEQRSQQEFSGKIDKAIGALAKDMFPGVNLAEHPVLNEFAQDVYLSYDPNDPTLEREYPNLLKSRLDGVLKLAAAINQAKLQQAREQRRQFLKPGGNAQPSGQGNGQPQRLSHRDIARNLFAADAMGRT